MDQHVIIFNVGSEEEKKYFTFWNPYSSRMGSNYFTHSIGNDARLARWKYSEVNSSSTVDLCLVLSLQDSRLKSSTDHSSACISCRWREKTLEVENRKGMVVTSICCPFNHTISWNQKCTFNKIESTRKENIIIGMKYSYHRHMCFRKLLFSM